MFVIIHETKHPVTGVRWFKAFPSIYPDEAGAAAMAQQVAQANKCRAWACEFPMPALVEVARVADISKYRK